MNKSKYCGITGDELANMLRKPSKYSKKEAEEIIKKAEELTPLEELGFLKGYILDSSSIYFDMLVKKFEAIETALKDYEYLKLVAKPLTDEEKKSINNVAKRLKALEIIKEHLQASCLTTIEKVVVDVVRMTFTQEEFDLLKEVLK